MVSHFKTFLGNVDFYHYSQFTTWAERDQLGKESGSHFCLNGLVASYFALGAS